MRALLGQLGDRNGLPKCPSSSQWSWVLGVVGKEPTFVGSEGGQFATRAAVMETVRRSPGRERSLWRRQTLGESRNSVAGGRRRALRSRAAGRSGGGWNELVHWRMGHKEGPVGADQRARPGVPAGSWDCPGEAAGVARAELEELWSGSVGLPTWCLGVSAR